MTKKENKNIDLSKYYTSGQFAKMANVSTRTIRYYDNQNILKGVAVENIDISNMSKEEAKERLRKHLESVIPKELELVYGEEYNAKIEPEQIDLKYDIDATVEEAYNVGRDGTLLENNYKIIGTRIFGTRI